MAGSKIDEGGLFAHILRERNVWLAVALIVILSVIVLYLDTKTQAPNFSLRGATEDLIKEAAAGIVALLLGFLIANILLRHDREILSRSEVDRIAGTVADKVTKVVRTPPFDLLLLDDDRDNAHILAEAEEEVCISRETGNSLFKECHPQIEKKLQAGCRFKIVLTDPDSQGAEHTDFRLCNMGKSPLKARHAATRAMLNRIFRSDHNVQSRVELRYSAFALPGTAIITDPRRPDRRSEILYRQVGHLSTRNSQRFSLRVDSDNSPSTAAVITDEFFRIFQTASKTVVMDDERLATFGWPELFPKFFQRDWGKPRLESQGKPFVSFAEPGTIFLIAFDFEKNPAGFLGSGTPRYYVRFGYAHRPGERVIYAAGDGDKWKISLDGLMALRAAFDAAVAAGSAIMIVNFGPIALGMPEACAAAELAEQDLTISTPAENREFYLRHRDPLTGLMHLSLAPAVEPLLENRRAHLYLHFQRPDLVRSSPFYAAVSEHERTTVLDAADIDRELPLELQGTAIALKYAPAAA